MLPATCCPGPHYHTSRSAGMNLPTRDTVHWYTAEDPPYPCLWLNYLTMWSLHDLPTDSHLNLLSFHDCETPLSNYLSNGVTGRHLPHKHSLHQAYSTLLSTVPKAPPSLSIGAHVTTPVSLNLTAMLWQESCSHPEEIE